MENKELNFDALNNVSGGAGEYVSEYTPISDVKDCPEHRTAYCPICEKKDPNSKTEMVWETWLQMRMYATSDVDGYNRFRCDKCHHIFLKSSYNGQWYYR